MSLKKISRYFAPLIVIVAMVFFLVFPERYIGCVKDGISLWAVSVLPATFPFLFLTALFTRFHLFSRLSRAISPLAKKAFRVSGEGGCIAVLSLLSGYPVGARAVLDLYERGAVKKGETFRLACLCSTTGPMFLVGVVGASMFQSPLLGWILLLSHDIGVLLVCFALRFSAKPVQSVTLAIPQTKQENLLYDSIYSSVISILCVGGSIALFYAFGQMIADLGAFLPFDATSEAVLRGLMEMTSGCVLLAQNPSPLSLALCCFLVTFGGLCVLAQQIAYLSRAEVKILPFLGVKLLQAILAGGICYLFGLLIL